MTWKEIFTFGRKLETIPDKVKFYAAIVLIGLIIEIAIGAAYSLIMFASYDDDFLRKQARKDLNAFVFSAKPFKDTRFTFLKKLESKNGTLYCAYSKYTKYSYCLSEDTKRRAEK